MINYFASSKKEILTAWKHLRSTLTSNQTDLEQLQLVVDFWKQAPIQTKIVINWDDPENWLTPWELISNNEYDSSAVAIGMYYTLILSEDNRWTNNRLSLLLINDKSRSIQQLVLEVDNKFVLNLEYGTIVHKDFTNTIVVQNEYFYNGKKFLEIKTA